MPWLNQWERSSNYEDKSNKNKKPNWIKGVFKAWALATWILAAWAWWAWEKGENYDTSTNNSKEVSSLLSKTKEWTQELFKQIFLVWEASAWENPQIKLWNLEVKEWTNPNIMSLKEVLNLSEKTEKELSDKIEKLKNSKSIQWITSIYDEENNRYILIIKDEEWNIELNVWLIDSWTWEEAKGKKQWWTEIYLWNKKGKEKVWNIMRFEQWWKWVEVVEKWNDAIISFFWFSGWNVEWDENKWLKSSNRISADAWISWQITEDIALGWWIKVWPEQIALLAFTWLKFWNYNTIMFSCEHYIEKRNIDTSVWEKEATQSQNKLSAKFSHKVSDGSLNKVELEWSYSKSNDENVFSKTDTTTSTQIIDTPDSIITRTTTNTYETKWELIWWKELQATLSTVWKLSENDKLTTWLQVTNREYNDWESLWTDLGLKVDYEKVIKEYNKLRFWISADKEAQRLEAWLYRKLWYRDEVWVRWFYDNREHGQDNYGAMLEYRHSFWWGKETTETEWYKLFPEDWNNINQETVDFARSQQSQSIDMSKYDEATKLKSSVTTEQVQAKPEAQKPETKPNNPNTPPENPEKPKANPDTFSTTKDTPTTFNPLDNDEGKDLKLISVTWTNWTYEKVWNSVKYTPLPWFTWNTTWSYVVESNWVQVTWTFTWEVKDTTTPPENPEKPKANPDTFSTTKDTPTTFNPLDNDEGKDLKLISVTWTNWTYEKVWNSVKYTPLPWFTWNTTWSYVVESNWVQVTWTFTWEVKDTTTPPEEPNRPPIWENKTVYVYWSTWSTTVDISDPDWDEVSIEFAWSGVLWWDPSISNSSASWKTVSITVNWWTWSAYVDYKVKDSKWKYSIKIYRVTFHNLDWV